jgi:hypothetical protein
MVEMNESAQVTPWETPGGPQPTGGAHHGVEERGSRSSGRRSGRRRLSRCPWDLIGSPPQPPCPELGLPLASLIEKTQTVSTL